MWCKENESWFNIQHLYCKYSLCVLTVTFEGFPLREVVYLSGECHSLCLRRDAFSKSVIHAVCIADIYSNRLIRSRCHLVPEDGSLGDYRVC